MSSLILVFQKNSKIMINETKKCLILSRFVSFIWSAGVILRRDRAAAWVYLSF